MVDLDLDAIEEMLDLYRIRRDAMSLYGEGVRLLAEVRRITRERDVALRERDEARTTLDEVRRQRNTFAARIKE